MLHSRYMESRCRKPGWLHVMKDTKVTATGTLERCERCGFSLKVPRGMPNKEYIKYHVKEILRVSDPQFKREFPNSLLNNG